MGSVVVGAPGTARRQATRARKVLDVEDVLDFATTLPAVLSAIDCPLALPAMAPFGTDGTALVECDPSEPTYGVRWGCACFWDGRTPHDMLPLDVVLNRPPRQLYVATREECDFIYDASRLSELGREHQQSRRAVREGIRVESAPLDPALMLDLYDAWAVHCGRDSHVYLAHWRQTLARILRHAITRPSVVERTHCTVLRARSGSPVGAQWTWTDASTTSTLHTPIRYLLPAYRFGSRLLLAGAADLAVRRGCRFVNDGDALGSVGMFHFKASLKPAMLRAYVDAVTNSPLERVAEPR